MHVGQWLAAQFAADDRLPTRREVAYAVNERLSDERLVAISDIGAALSAGEPSARFITISIRNERIGGPPRRIALSVHQIVRTQLFLYRV